MKSSLASLLVLNILNLPDGTLSFTARPLQSVGAGRVAMSSPTISATATPRNPTQLHGLLPDFLTRNKSSDTDDDDVDDGKSYVPSSAGEAISSEMTELALETTVEEEEEKELTPLEKVKKAGTAGAISYALWELGFWGISIPVCVVGYYEVTGHMPDFSNQEDMQKLGAEAFAFVNFARFAVPLRIGLALSTTPWIDENIVQKFMKKDEGEEGESEE